MRTLTRLVALTAVLALVGCTSTARGLPRDAAALVDGTVVSRTVLEAAVAELVPDPPSNAQERAAAVGPVQRQVLSLMIQAKIIENLADERGATIDQSVVDERFQEQAELVGGEEELASALAGSNLTLELFQDVLLPAQLRVEALTDTVESIDTRTVRHILLETEAEALDVVAELEDGADFGELAEERSQDPGSAVDGGNLGPAPPGSYVPQFEEAAWAAEIGEVVGPVGTDFGFHVLEVTAEDQQSTADLEPQEREQVVGSEVNRLLTEAFTGADVVIGTGLGEWDAQQSAVVESDAVGDSDVIDELPDPEGEAPEPEEQ